jgi:hypothetical protein
MIKVKLSWPERTSHFTVPFHGSMHACQYVTGTGDDLKVEGLHIKIQENWLD